MKRYYRNATAVRTKLAFWNVGVLALTLAVSGAIVRYSVQVNLANSLDREISARAHRYASTLPDLRRAGISGGRRASASRYGTRMLDTNGRPAAPYNTEPAWDMRLVPLSLQGREVFGTTRSGGENIRVVSIPVMAGGRVTAILQTAMPLTEQARDLAALSRTLLMLIPVALLVAGVFGAFLTDRALRPVRGIAEAAERIRADNLAERLSVSGKDEFSRLAHTINSMLGRLEHAFEQQRQFTADASHELRTPLTVIRANTSLALSGPQTLAGSRQALEAADRAAARMDRILADLLLLATADSERIVGKFEPTSLSLVLQLARESFPGTDHAAIECRTGEHWGNVHGDASQLVRLFTNIIDNAIRYTPRDGRIVISAADHDDMVEVTVRDTGAGIPPEHLPHILERFYRVDAARARASGGAGLGLAICRSIVTVHAGLLTIDSVYGEGTAVKIKLPRAHAAIALPQAAAGAL